MKTYTHSVAVCSAAGRNNNSEFYSFGFTEDINLKKMVQINTKVHSPANDGLF